METASPDLEADPFRARPLGRVWINNPEFREFVWMSGGTWESTQDPEIAAELTACKIGREINSAMPDAYDNVLIYVASLFDGASWELLVNISSCRGRIH